MVGMFNQVVGLIRCGDQQHWVKTEHAISAGPMPAQKAVRMPPKAA